MEEVVMYAPLLTFMGGAALYWLLGYEDPKVHPNPLTTWGDDPIMTRNIRHASQEEERRV